MHKEEYAAIAAACDRLLRASDTNLTRIAIPLLHVVNEHPDCINHYRSLLHEPAAARSQPRSLSTSLAVRIVRRALLALRRTFQPAVSLTIDQSGNTQPVVLIVSRLSGSSQLQGDSDFYFGDMQRLLRERGANAYRVLIDHGSQYPVCVGSTADNDRGVLALAVPPGIELQIWFRCAREAWRLRRAARRASGGLDAALALLASRHALTGGTADNLRLHSALSALCRQVKPDIVITTYEGTASERVIWHAARTGRRRLICVGYQHTKLLQRAHAIRRPVLAPGQDCDPDVILTLGSVTHAMLASSALLGSAQLIFYGSHRRGQRAAAIPTGERSSQCLVIPDAGDTESAYLFDVALECARLRPDVRFVLRPHPMVRPSLLQALRESQNRVAGNVVISTAASLEEDCMQARYCLYRGSSAVFQAVLCGVEPFYLGIEGELPIDPLFELDEWRKTVRTAEELARCLDATTTSDDAGAPGRARMFCDQYVSPVRPEALDELLNQVIVARRPAPTVPVGSPLT